MPYAGQGNDPPRQHDLRRLPHDGRRVGVRQLRFCRSRRLRFFSGKVVWSRDLNKLEHIFGPATTPVLYHDLLIIHRGPGVPTHIVALNKRSGETVWDTPEAGKNDQLYGSWSTPVIFRAGDHDEFALSMPGELKGYDPLTGKELWRCEGLGPSNYPDTAIGPDVLIGVSGFRKSMLAVRMGAEATSRRPSNCGTSRKNRTADWLGRRA